MEVSLVADTESVSPVPDPQAVATAAVRANAMLVKRGMAIGFCYPAVIATDRTP
jgi:hypothetical protein